MLAHRTEGFLARLGFKVKTGETYEASRVSTKVSREIASADVVIGLLVEPQMSEWLIHELAFGAGANKAVIPLIGTGVKPPVGIFGDIEWIPIPDNDDLGDVFTRLIEGLRSLGFGVELGGPRRSLATLDYGLLIVAPEDGAFVRVKRSINISGTYQIKPPEAAVRLFNVSANGRYLWPQVPSVLIDESKKSWTGESYVVGDTFVMVATVGESGQILCDYYARVGRDTGAWPPLERLPTDVIEWHRVWIRAAS